ncbi:hypothetical protein PGTUg99_000266 [Puccinia graminis f. sp. tritici]|uniref:Uncharacterized protein n=1 Tax=Puccinia graminis f. sp. tritici TaxID=56615 RepID=A0A5B0S9F8_PUCGR|nr:hypothetical protein PGTUg99_000266 [Puccinia graminis f. sp. tritici]
MPTMVGSSSTQILKFETGVLRKAASRQINLQYEPKQIEFGFCQPSDPSSLNKIASAPQALSRSGSMHSSVKTIFTLHWKDFLPSLERGNKVSAHVWRSEPFQRTQEQIVGDGIKDISAFYWKLRRYAMHTLWHIVLAALVKSSYIALCISLGAFDGLTLSDFEVAVFQWVNITWNCGVGFLLGLVSNQANQIFQSTHFIKAQMGLMTGFVFLALLHVFHPRSFRALMYLHQLRHFPANQTHGKERLISAKKFLDDWSQHCFPNFYFQHG